MFLWLFGIFVYFVKWGQADLVSGWYYETLNVTREILGNASPWMYYSRQYSKNLFECTHIGRYPFPYDCRSYYTCSKIAGSLERNVRVKPWWPNPKPCNPDSAHFEEHIGCIIASELCTCPPGTFWAGPSAGCVKDLKGMKACCNFKPNCVNGDGGDFGKCILSTLGYKYSCLHDGVNKENRPVIRVEKCKGYGVSRDKCFPENPLKLTDLDLETYTILPVCKPIKHIMAEGSDTKSTTLLILEFHENALPEKLIKLMAKQSEALLKEAIREGKSPGEEFAIKTFPDDTEHI